MSLKMVLRSPVYVWREGQFRLDHHLDTLQASDVESKSVGGTTWLVFSEGEFHCPTVIYSHAILSQLTHRFSWSVSTPVVH